MISKNCKFSFTYHHGICDQGCDARVCVYQSSQLVISWLRARQEEHRSPNTHVPHRGNVNVGLVLIATEGPVSSYDWHKPQHYNVQLKKQTWITKTLYLQLTSANNVLHRNTFATGTTCLLANNMQSGSNYQNHNGSNVIASPCTVTEDSCTSFPAVTITALAKIAQSASYPTQSQHVQSGALPRLPRHTRRHSSSPASPTYDAMSSKDTFTTEKSETNCTAAAAVSALRFRRRALCPLASPASLLTPSSVAYYLQKTANLAGSNAHTGHHHSLS